MKSPIENQSGLSEGELIKAQYGDGGLNLKLRWQVYKHAQRPLDIISDVIGKSNIETSDSLLDVGCNDGEFLDTIRMKGHLGKLVGLDVSKSPLQFGNQRQKNHNSDIQYINGSAEELPLSTDSFDTATTLFTLYHVANPEKALKEIRRVVKPNGSVIVSTSGAKNKILHRAFERLIANELNVEPPKIFNSGFTTEIAQRVLPYFFDVKHRIDHLTDMKISTTTQMGDYVLSLMSMRTAFAPVPSKDAYSEALDRIGNGLIHTQKNNPELKLIDSIDRTYYICKNNKK